MTLHDGRIIEPRFVVDTGTVEPLVLRPSFAAAHRIVDTTTVEALQLGRYSLPAMPVAVRRTNSDDLVDADGTIGSGTLRRFRVTFDHARSRIFVRPGALFGIPYEYDASGLRIVANGNEFGVGEVVGGYAAPAGVRVLGDGLEQHFRVGDVIVQFDGLSPAGWTLDAMRGAFKADGRSHAVLVRRHGTLVTISYEAPAWQR
jgi:hypothetical protein